MDFMENNFTIIEKYYQSDSFKMGGRKFKKFFSDLCKNTFETNFAIYQRCGAFPILYSEKNSYSAMSVALDKMGYGHISELGIDCRGKQSVKQDSENVYRFIDFWCGTHEEDIWIEVKNLEFNAGKRASYCFDASNHSRIENAIKQIDDLKKLKEEGFKLALFNIGVYFNENQEPKQEDLIKIPEIIADDLARYLDGRRYMGLLCGVLDLREQMEQCDFYDFEDGKTYVPYVIMGGIVLQ